MNVVLSGPEPRLTLVDGKPRTPVSACGNGCSDRARCSVCGHEIRLEALRWLRELNTVPVDQPDSLSWHRAWSRDLLLAHR